MTVSIKDLIEEILIDLKKVGGIITSAAVTRDGLLIASEAAGETDIEMFGAMTATMTGAAETAVNEMKGGNVQRVIVEAESSKIISIGAGPKALLIVLASPDVPLGLILLKMSDASQKLTKIIGG